MAFRRPEIRALANDLLAQNRVEHAPVPVEQIVRNLGVEIIRTTTQDELSGFMLRDGSRGRNVIGVNAGHSPTRQRFTIAHELGHYLLHHGNPVHVDGVASYRIDRRNPSSSRGDEPHEIEANMFAAELLMPEEFLREDVERGDEPVDLSDDSDIERLAAKYQVSSTAMTFRLANLRFIRLDSRPRAR